MKVEILRPRMYRGEALDAGRITDMDVGTADWFISRGWAKPAAEAPVLTTDQADALLATNTPRRKAIR